jgi:hypothetical protein
VRFPGPTHRNIYVGSQAAAERVLESIREWIEKHLRLQLNATKSGTGRPWERKFLGFRVNRESQIEVSPESWERFRTKVREKWRSCQSRTSNQPRDAWRQYIRGWRGYYRLAENGRPIIRLEGWIRRQHPGLLLTAVARTGRKRATATPTRAEGADAESGSEFPGSLAFGEDRESATGALERDPAEIRLSDAIGSSGSLTPLVSTAGCGKPHVRWCGRVTGRNPVTRPNQFQQECCGLKKLCGIML